MMKAKFYFFFLFVLSPILRVSAQHLNYNEYPWSINANAFWAWYDNNGLDFSSGAPTHVPSALSNNGQETVVEGVASVSDPISGELLFYTNGGKVWDKNHNIMPNGDSLMGNWRSTTVQGSIITPVVGNTNQYYIFSLGGVDSRDPDPAQAGLYYSIVDMTLENGNGDILQNAKNIPLDTTRIFLESMVAIPGNNCNIWLVTHEFFGETFGDLFSDTSSIGNKNYLAYEISSSGVNHSPIISQGLTGRFSSGNHMSVSPDRTKIFHADALSWLDAALPNFNTDELIAELVNFDPNTGTISNPVAIVSSFGNSYIAGAFSPNSEKLYVTEFQSNSGNFRMTLKQFDVSVIDSLSVNSSSTVVDTLPAGSALSLLNFHACPKLYRDSIYILYANSNWIGRINAPDSNASSCDFQPNAIQLPLPYKTDQMVASPPSEVVYPMSVVNMTLLDTAICESIALTPGHRQDIIVHAWNDGTTDSILNITGLGKYWVTYSYLLDNCIYQRTDTFVITAGRATPFPQITIDVDTLSTTVPYNTYQWMFNGDIINGATNSKYIVSENGNYQVIVSDEWGCVDTSEVYEVTNKTNSILDVSTGASVSVWPNPTRGILSVKSSKNGSWQLFDVHGRLLLLGTDKTIDITTYPAGVYYFELLDKKGEPMYRTKIVKL